MVNRDMDFDKVEACRKLEWIMKDKGISFKALSERVGINPTALKNAMDTTNPCIPFTKTQERILDYIYYNYRGDDE